MALDATILANDLKNDSQIMDDIPQAAKARVEVFLERLAVHVTAQIKRGQVRDVVVDPGTGEQTNSAPVV